MIVVPPDGAARSVAKNVVDAFGALGIAHETFDMGKVLPVLTELFRRPQEQLATDFANEHLAVRTLDLPATHVLVLALSPVTLFTLNLLRKHRVRTMHWFYEDFRRARYWRDVLPGYDCFAAVQRGPIEEACRARGVTFALINTATALAAPSPAENPARDIAFVGIPSPYRVAMLESLARAGMSLAIGGHGWDRYEGPLRRFIVSDRWMDRSELLATLHSARVGLNLSVASPREGGEHAQLSPRVYDIAAAGALLLTEEVPLAREGLEGCSYTTFDGPDRLVSQARELVSSFETRLGQRRSTQRAATERHTYTQRVRALVALEGGSEAPPP